MMTYYSPPEIASSTSLTNWREADKFLSAIIIVFFLTLFASENAQALTSVNQAGAIAQKLPSVIQVQKDATLIVGSEQDFPPFATGMTDATAGGFTVELWKAVAAEAGLNYSIRVLPFRQILKEFKKGKIDVLINLAVSDERDQFADFTVPHVIVQGAIFVREGASNIRSEDDLAGKSIIVLNADLAHDYAVSKGWEKQLVLVDTPAEGLRLLASGKHDAMLLSKLTGMQTLQGLGLTSIEALKVKPGFSQKFAFAVAKGQSGLLSRINEGLALTKSNGTYNALYDKWFGIYEDKEVGLSDLLIYILPLLVLFLGSAGYSFYQRQVERKSAHNRLKESETHLRLSQMDGGIGTWEADLVSNKQTWSDNCYALLGFPGLNNPTWKDFLAKVHPKDRQRVIDATSSHLDHGTKYEVEYRTIMPTGVVCWMRSAGQVERNIDGKPVRMRGIVQNITERKQAEERQRVSELALKAISQGVIISSADKRIRWVNDAFESITGYSPTEILGKTCCFLQGPLTDPQTVKAMRFALGNVTEFSGEVLNYRKDGSVFWNELMISPVRDEQGQLTHFIGVTRDITERKRYEMQISDNERHLLDILNVSPIAVRIAINHGREVVFYNQRYTDLIKNAHAMGDDPRSYYARAEEYQEVLAVLARGKAVLNRQIELRIPDGSTAWVLGSYMPMQYQGKDAVLGWFYDITERMEAQKRLTGKLELLRKAEETLRIANEEQHAIFDSATSGIVLIKDRVIMRCNRKLEEIFGYCSGELNGKPMRLWYPDDAAYETGGISVCNEIAAGKFHRLERLLIRKDGSFFWARLSGQALDNKDPSIGLVGIIDDITYEHEAAEALLRAKEMAEDTTRMKSEFLAIMSHEIRTPMNGVLGILDLLRETKMTPTQRDWVETAHGSAEALLEIINDIMDLSRLEAGKFEVEQVDFNLVDLVEDICALLAGRAHAKGLELNCLLPDPMPMRWRGDPMRIRQVLTNLIGNAVKFTGQGDICVSITRSHLSDSPNELRFEVHDTGIGISAEAQLQLFQPFSQADNTTSRRFGGSGLGLFISKKLVELMGGTIGMSSELGTGSCFWFTLPLKQSECRETTKEFRDVSGKRTLIVDDNAANRNTLSNYLNRWGLDVSQADNGSSALITLQTSAIKGEAYDLILLDMQMPGMDGLTLAKCLAQIPVLAKIPIILLSSGDQIDLADYQGTGIIQRLLKPVRQQQLFDAIVNALQGVSESTINPAALEVKLPSYDNYYDKKVLVVEDNKINQKVIIAKLAKFDIIPDLAENGQLALDKLAQSLYDLILMDCQMPVMDGYTATRELRLLETAKGLPHQTVIALTANALEGEREKCLAAGMDDYLTKPIITGQLLEILASRLGTQHGTG